MLGKPWETSDVGDRIPSLKAYAELEYHRRLELEQKKNESERLGYLDNEYTNFSLGEYNGFNQYR